VAQEFKKTMDDSLKKAARSLANAYRILNKKKLK